MKIKCLRHCWCFVKRFEFPVIWHAMTLMWRHYNTIYIMVYKRPATCFNIKTTSRDVHKTDLFKGNIKISKTAYFYHCVGPITPLQQPHQHYLPHHHSAIPWTSYRYVILRVAHAPGMPGTFSPATDFNSLRPGDAYMRRWINHHWFK